MLYKSKIKDSAIFYRAFVGHTKKLFWFSLPKSLMSLFTFSIFF